MMRLGLIGGTGLVSLAAGNLDIVRSDDVIAETDYGSVPMTCATLGNDSELIFVQRHHFQKQIQKQYYYAYLSGQFYLQTV